MSDDTASTLSMRIAVLGSASALFGSLIGVGGTLLATELQERHADDDRLRDKREEIYSRVLAHQQAQLDAPYAEITGLIERLAAEPPAPLPALEPLTDKSQAVASAVELSRTTLESRRLYAQLEVYGSVEVLGLFNDFLTAQSDELRALADAAKSETDDDKDADRRRQKALQRMVQANFELSQQVRSEVAA